MSGSGRRATPQVPAPPSSSCPWAGSWWEGERCFAQRRGEREGKRNRETEAGGGGGGFGPLPPTVGEGRLHPGHFFSLCLLLTLPEAVGPLGGGAGSSLLPFPSCPSALSGLRSLEPQCLEQHALPLLGKASTTRPRHPEGCGQWSHCCPQWAVRVWGLSSRPT